jgi:hypothetical protein
MRAGAAAPVAGPTAEAAERALLADCAELNIHPPQYPPGAQDSPGRAPDVAVAGGVDPAGGPVPIPSPEQGGGLEVMAGPVRTDAGAAGSSAALEWAAGLGLDPLALRLALLRCPYREPAALTAEALAQADADLRAWRWQVAGWATQPSKPISAAYRTRVYAAFDDDLDVPAALAVLAELADDDGVAQGARFETFAHLDQLLGLDLAREVGHAPPAGR